MLFYTSASWIRWCCDNRWVLEWGTAEGKEKLCETVGRALLEKKLLCWKRNWRKSHFISITCIGEAGCELVNLIEKFFSKRKLKLLKKILKFRFTNFIAKAKGFRKCFVWNSCGDWCSALRYQSVTRPLIGSFIKINVYAKREKKWFERWMPLYLWNRMRD